MTTSELSDLETLLLQVMPDPKGYTERVLQQLMDRLANQSPDGGQATFINGYDADAVQALMDRNLLLASALGACECWGEDPSCPNCAGMGTAGWVPPDRSLYAEYVEPAIQRMPAEGRSARNTVKDQPPSKGEQE